MPFERIDLDRGLEIELEDRSCKIAKALIDELGVPGYLNLTPAQADLLETYLAGYWLLTEEAKIALSLDKYSFLKRVPLLSCLYDRQAKQLEITASATGHLTEFAARKALLMDEDPNRTYLEYLQRSNLIQEGSLEDLTKQVGRFDPELAHDLSTHVGNSYGIGEKARKLSKFFFEESLNCLGRSRNIDPKLV